MSSIDDAINTINAQWYNAVVSQCGLDKQQFQLCQGCQPLGINSDMLWNIFDAIPPLSTNNYYDPGQANNFANDYGAVLFSLNSSGLSKLQVDLGDYYTTWLSWLADAKKQYPNESLYQLFTDWATDNCPDHLEDGQRDILAAQNDSVIAAMNMWVAAGGLGGARKAYDVTIDDVNNLILSQPGKHVEMDSSTQDANVTSTWAKVTASGWYHFFGGNVDAEYNSLILSFLSSGFHISADFKHVYTIAGKPLNEPNTFDPILKNFKPWYVSSVLSNAYVHNDYIAWQAGVTPDWNSTFGPQGNMLRRTSSIIAVNGISITINSHASLNEDDFLSFQKLANLGIWPFFQAHGDFSMTTSCTHNDDGTITVTTNCPEGKNASQVLGILQTPAPNYFSNML